MSSFRAIPWALTAFMMVASNGPAHAWHASKLFAKGPHPIVKIEGRKGTRLYRPDESEDYRALVEGEEKAAPGHEPTAQEKLDQCMASWGAQTHITKANWRKICERQFSEGPTP